MEYNKLVSVVMPVHNGERFLSEAIESVLNQTYTNFEFLIVENCSTDSSVEIIKSYNDSRIRLIVEKECGQIQAYNRGFKEAKGEYVFIQDHDDISEIIRFSEQLYYIVNKGIDILGSNFAIIDSKNNLLFNRFCPEYNKDIQKSIYFKINSLFNPTVCIRKSIFERFGFFDQSVFPSSDYEFYLRVQGVVKCGNIQKSLYQWRNLTSSLSHQNSKFGNQNAFNLSMKYFNKRKDDFSQREAQVIQTNMYYYFNYMGKAMYSAIIGLVKFPSIISLKLLSKIFILWLPITLFGRDNLFNSSLMLQFRKYFKYNEVN